MTYKTNGEVRKGKGGGEGEEVVSVDNLIKEEEEAEPRTA